MKWLHYDRLGNVVNKSGSAGTLTDTYYQDAYGNVLSNVNTGAWATPSSFSGRHLTTKEYDNQAYLYYFWQRWYDPQVAVFVSVAPAPVYVEHPYGYARDNPVKFIDSLGEDPVSCVIATLIAYLRHHDTEDDLNRHCKVGCTIAKGCGLLSCGLIGDAWEILQGIGIIPGTYDPVDGGAHIVGCLACRDRLFCDPEDACKDVSRDKMGGEPQGND